MLEWVTTGSILFEVDDVPLVASGLGPKAHM